MKFMNFKRIMFAGPSGIGKTTLAKWISEQYQLPFLSGSVSDLLPETRDVKHQDMLNRDSKTLFTEDFQIMNLRNKLFKDKTSFVSDRSYIDSATYCLYKQADKLPACELEHFIDTAKILLNTQCDLLVVLDFIPEMINEWVTEDNNKRITSNYFQVEIASIVNSVLKLCNYECDKEVDYIPSKGISSRFNFTKYNFLKYGYSMGNIETVYGNTQVVIIREMNLDIRKNIISTLL